MKLTPSSTARRKTFFAFSRSGGQPQIPSPVNRIAPNPSRLTNRSPPSRNVLLTLMLALASGIAARIFCNPPVKTPAALAEIAPKKVLRVTSLFIQLPSLLLKFYFLLLTFFGPLHPQKSIPETFFVSSQIKYVGATNTQHSVRIYSRSR